MLNKKIKGIVALTLTGLICSTLIYLVMILVG